MPTDKVRSYGSGSWYEKKGSQYLYWGFSFEGRRYGDRSSGIRIERNRQGEYTRACLNLITDYVAARVAEVKRGDIEHKHESSGDVTVARVCELYMEDLRKRSEAKGRDFSAKMAGIQLRHTLSRFGKRSANSLTTLELKEYREDREDDGVCPRTTNRELAYLHAALNYGHKHFTPRLVKELPYFPMESEEGNTREGFLERDDYEVLKKALPSSLVPILVVGWHVGARRAEMLKLEWSDVDLEKRSIFFRGRNVKNGEGRVVPVWGDMYQCLVERKRIRDEQFPALQHVIFWDWNGARVNDFRKAWRSSCEHSGVPDLLVHDLRRSAIRVMIRAGFSEKQVMTISGHKTASVFKRYEMYNANDAIAMGAELDKRVYGKTLELVRKAEAV